MKLAIAITLMLVASIAQADKRFVPLSATEGLLVESASPVTFERIPIQQIGVVPVTPGPVVPVPLGTLAEVVKKATAAVTDPNKDENARSIAFSINFVKPYLVGSTDVTKITAILKTMADSSMGNDAVAWSGWWASIDTATKGMTVAQYSTALDTITTGLTADSNFASGEFLGVENYGLDPAKLMKLLEFILKYLPMILALFA